MTTERKNITQPAKLWAAAKEQARRDGYSLSEWIATCIVANLDKDLARDLPERRRVGNPTFGKPE